MDNRPHDIDCPIPPDENQNVGKILVGEPAEHAFGIMKKLLFDPFDLGRWFLIALGAWPAGWHSFSFNFQYRQSSGGAAFPGALDFYWRDLFHPPFVFILPVAVVLLIVLGIFWVWLGGRGEFMFLYCVARREAKVSYPWKEYHREGNSLFLFRMALTAISILLLLLIGGTVFGLLAAAGVFKQGTVNQPAIFWSSLIPAILIGAMAALVLGLTHLLTTDFVTIIMFTHRCRVMRAWRILWDMLIDRPIAFFLYLLVRLFLHIVCGIVITIAGFLTCCCGFILFALPYIGTVATLPIHVYLRSYSICFLQQFGPGFDAFLIPVTPNPQPQEPNATTRPEEPQEMGQVFIDEYQTEDFPTEPENGGNRTSGRDFDRPDEENHDHPL